MKKTVSSQRRGLPIFLICRGPCTQRDRLIQTSSRVLSCLLKVGCGRSPVLQLPVLFGKLGISHTSWPKMWDRGESNRRSDFTTGAKVCECVRKLVCLLSQRVRGRLEASGACCGSIANSGCVTGSGGETKGSLCR